MKKKLLLSLISIFIAFAAFEAVLRLMVVPSVKSSGSLFGRELPPMKILRADQILSSEEEAELRDRWFDPLIVNGEKITYSDLFGIMRDDELLGYTIKENSRSTNGWRQANNLGARSDKFTPPGKAAQIERILFFGDSYTFGDRVPENETFVFYLNEKNKNFEALNFGVSGYSVGQAYLRFTTLKDEIEFDRVFLVFVPESDIWREVNVSRYIGDGWEFYGLKIMPRFVIENGELKLIKSPYKSLKEQLDDNSDTIKPRLRDHLRKYDFFYKECMYESNSVLDKLITYKLLKLNLFNNCIKTDKSHVMKKDSEAVEIIKRVIDTMAQEVESKGAEFTLVILPKHDEIKEYAENPTYKKTWDDISSFLCSGEISCLDLMKDFQRARDEVLDTGYDDTHYGPKANGLIADFILDNAIIMPSIADAPVETPTDN